MSLYDDLLELLKKHVVLFQELADTQQIKLDAAKEYNISKLDECMKKEQADTLVLRGFDKKRLNLMTQLSYEGMTFQEFIPLLPKEYEYGFTQEFQKLNDVYTLYRSTADCAKQIIEVNLYRLGIAIESLKQQNNLVSGDVYTPTGVIGTETLTFRDMKI